MLKIYPKTFEDAFSSGPAQRKCLVENVLIRDFYSNKDYVEFANKELRKMYEQEWMTIVKSSWLFSKFTYKGKRRIKMFGNSQNHDAAFSIFHRQYVGIDIRLITRSPIFNKIYVYFKDFFPEFDKHNPFEEPEYYKFPYKNITLDFLPTIYQMPEKLEILAYVDEQKMSYNVFLDFLLNYCHSYNEEHGDEIYMLSLASDALPYVRYKYNLFKRKRKNLMQK